MKPIIKKRGSVIIGAMYASWPFGSIKLYDDHLILHAILKKAMLPYAKINKIKTKSGRKISFIHSSNNPPEISFFSFSKNRDILVIFKNKGIDIVYF